MILDLLALPDVFGEELCRCARVVCIGGQGAAPPASRALRAGAFDYVARSCDREELEARLDCAASRAKPRVVVRLDAARSTVEALGIELPLRPAELAVLAEIVGHPTVPIPSRHLVSRALGASGDGGSARNQVFEVRRKFREAGLPDPVKTLPGSGYCVADSVVITLTQTGE